MLRNMVKTARNLEELFDMSSHWCHMRKNNSSTFNILAKNTHASSPSPHLSNTSTCSCIFLNCVCNICTPIFPIGHDLKESQRTTDEIRRRN